MSVLMEMRVKANPQRLQEVMDSKPDLWQRIITDAKQKGCLHHQFLTDNSGNVLISDEWQNKEGFENFFANNQDVQTVMKEAGVQGEPQISYWNPLDTPDKF